MKASELRLGNVVFINGTVSEIETITEDGINQDVDFGEYGSMNYSGWFSNAFYQNSIEPIPITEEWLMKFGFKNKGSHYYSFPEINHTLEINLHKSNLGIEFKLLTQRLVEPRTQIGINIQYVHQLQNLYFALTREELIIK